MSRTISNYLLFLSGPTYLWFEDVSGWCGSRTGADDLWVLPKPLLRPFTPGHPPCCRSVAAEHGIQTRVSATTTFSPYLSTASALPLPETSDAAKTRSPHHPEGPHGTNPPGRRQSDVVDDRHRDGGTDAVSPSLAIGATPGTRYRVRAALLPVTRGRPLTGAARSPAAPSRQGRGLPHSRRP